MLSLPFLTIIVAVQLSVLTLLIFLADRLLNKERDPRATLSLPAKILLFVAVLLFILSASFVIAGYFVSGHLTPWVPLPLVLLLLVIALPRRPAAHHEKPSPRARK